MTEPLSRTGDASWEPGAVEMPQVPMLPAGEDPMSATIAAVLPTLTAPLAADVAALQGKETMFAGKLGAANAAYASSENSGQQGVMQVVQSLGQLGSQAGQMGGMAGAPGQMGGQFGGTFASLMQPLMQAFQGAGQGGHGQSFGAEARDSAAGNTGQNPLSMGGSQQRQESEDRHGVDRHGDRTMAEPQAGGDFQHALDPGLVLPPEHHHGEGDDLARRM